MDEKGSQLGKGIAVGLCGLGIGLAAAVTGNSECLFAFFPLAFITLVF